MLRGDLQICSIEKVKDKGSWIQSSIYAQTCNRYLSFCFPLTEEASSEIRLEADDDEIAEHAIPNKRDADSRVSESTCPRKFLNHDRRCANREAINCRGKKENKLKSK